VSFTPGRNSEDEFFALVQPFRFYKRQLALRKSNVFEPLIPLWLLLRAAGFVCYASILLPGSPCASSLPRRLGACHGQLGQGRIPRQLR
jgi:hypothetical protein